MENVFDLKYQNELYFIFSSTSEEKSIPEKEVAIILYLYYEDTVSKYLKYIDKIGKNINVYIVSPLDSVLLQVKKYAIKLGMENIYFLKKPNCGRDISGLLITSKSIISSYKYVCFLHDKKAHTIDMEKDTEFWIKNIWGNLIADNNYIRQVIDKFEQDNRIGILAPPAPVGEHFCTWYGYGWHGSFEVTQKIAQRLDLDCDLDKNKPPITIGTALWFRTKALEKLFSYEWKYSDFEDKNLARENYLSYGIERIFAYVAQDAGFLTGEVMTSQYAQKQNLFLQYSMAEIFSYSQAYFPFPDLNSVRKLSDNLKRLLQSTADKTVLLYGAGDMGRFCLNYLRKNEINAVAFVTTQENKDSNQDGIPIIGVDDIKKYRDYKIVITVAKREIQNEMIEELTKRGIQKYTIFWR